jgi:hypothetical protein
LRGDSGTLKISNADVALLLPETVTCVFQGDVNLIARLNFVEHSRIDDTSVVFPAVRTSEGDRIISGGRDGRWPSKQEGGDPIIQSSLAWVYFLQMPVMVASGSNYISLHQVSNHATLNRMRKKSPYWSRYWA